MDLAAEYTEAHNVVSLRRMLLKTANKPGSGVCHDCHEAIETERLRAYPLARLCTFCADQQAEEAEKVRRRGPAAD